MKIILAEFSENEKVIFQDTVKSLSSELNNSPALIKQNIGVCIKSSRAVFPALRQEYPVAAFPPPYQCRVFPTHQ